MKFTDEVISEIKSYVYIYINPSTKKVFYIGKGQGNRCFEHLEDSGESEKVKEINELKSRGELPIIELLRYGLTDNEASLIESSLIDFVGLGELTNKVRGLHSKSFGRTTINDITIKYMAEEVTVIDNVILITINKLFHSNMTEEELYEVTRGLWYIGKRREKAKFAFAIFQGVVREVFEINKWHQAGTLNYNTRDSLKFQEMKRWEFDGKVASDEIRKKYIKKSIRHYIKQGSQNPIKYIHC